MADNYNADYMKRIAFLDGQVLHDFHLNNMQKNIAEAIKLQTLRASYDFFLMVTSYNMYFLEPFVTTDERDLESTAEWDQLTFSFSAGAWESKLLVLPDVTEEICLKSSFVDNPAQGAYVNFFYRTAVDTPWIPINQDEPVPLAVPKNTIQFKAECTYSGTVRPYVYDVALFWK